MLLNALVNWVEWRDRPYSRGRVFFTTICCLIAAIFSIGTEYRWSDKNGDGYYGFALTLGILLAWFGSFSKRNFDIWATWFILVAACCIKDRSLDGICATMWVITAQKILASHRKFDRRSWRDWFLLPFGLGNDDRNELRGENAGLRWENAELRRQNELLLQRIEQQDRQIEQQNQVIQQQNQRIEQQDQLIQQQNQRIEQQSQRIEQQDQLIQQQNQRIEQQDRQIESLRAELRRHRQPRHSYPAGQYVEESTVRRNAHLRRRQSNSNVLNTDL